MNSLTTDDLIHWDEVEEWGDRIPRRAAFRPVHDEWETVGLGGDIESDAWKAAQRAAAEAKRDEAMAQELREHQAALDRKRDAERAKQRRIQDMAERHSRRIAYVERTTPYDSGLTSMDPPSEDDDQLPAPAPKPKRTRCDCKHLMRDHGKSGCEEEDAKLYPNGWRVKPCPCKRTPEQVLAAVS